MRTVLDAEVWIGHSDAGMNWWKADWNSPIPVVPRPTHHGEHPISGWPTEGCTRSEWWREARRAFTGDVDSVRKITDSMNILDILAVARGGALKYGSDV